MCHKASESDRAAIIAKKEIGREREREREPREIERRRLVDREDRKSQAWTERQREGLAGWEGGGTGN